MVFSILVFSKTRDKQGVLKSLPQEQLLCRLLCMCGPQILYTEAGMFLLTGEKEAGGSGRVVLARSEKSKTCAWVLFCNQSKQKINPIISLSGTCVNGCCDDTGLRALAEVYPV